jgi:hypothetical protein
MRIINYQIPQEQELNDFESRYFLPKELVDEIAYAAERGREAFDRISAPPSDLGQKDTTPTTPKSQNMSKPLIYISGAAILGLGIYFSYRFYTQKKNKK